MKAKDAARQQKDRMQSMNLPVSGGSEGAITPEAQWIADHGVWSESDVPMQDSAHASSSRAATGE